MKGLVLSLFVAVGFLFANNAAAQQVGGANIEFEKKEHDYGVVEKGGNGVCIFEFTNTGDQPLLIQNAKGSCGCTVPEWPRQPIAPGQTGEIKVKYDTNRVGNFSKSVTLTTNSSANPTVVLRIKGQVVDSSAPSPNAPAGAPAN